MPPKSKSKGPPLSPEEVLERKQARKAKALEKKAAKVQAAEDRSNFLKMERLGKEVNRGILNTKRFSKSWMEIAMRANFPHIKEDLEVAWHSFDRALDSKNYSISLMLDEVDKANEQYQVNERFHQEMISRLIGTYRERLFAADKYFQNEVQEIATGTLKDTETIVNKQTNDENFLQVMMFAMEQQLEALMKNVKGSTISKVGELEDDNRNLRRVAKFLLEKKFRHLWDEFMDNLSRYQNETEDLCRKYNVVKDKDDKARRVIIQQLNKTSNLFESIQKYKEKISTYKLEATKEISEIQAEYDLFNKLYWTVKTRFVAEQAKDKEQLKIITKEYRSAVTHLKKILDKGDNLLSLIKICKKYETLEEKLHRFKPQEQIEGHTDNLAIDFAWDRSRAVMEEVKNLELFWRRVGSAELVAKKLRSERDTLKRENEYLKKCLEQCLTESSLAPDTIHRMIRETDRNSYQKCRPIFAEENGE